MQRPIWLICGTHLLVEVYLLVQVALIPVLIQEFGMGILEASLIATIPSLVALLMNLPVGLLADRFSPNQLLCTSMLIEGASALLVSQTRDFWTLLLCVSLLKLSSPVYHVSGLSQISRLAEPKKIVRQIGFHNALGNVGTTTGLITLAASLPTIGWRWTYFFWAFPAIVWGFIVLRSKPLKVKGDNKPEGRKTRSLNRLRLILLPGLLTFLVIMAIREVGATSASTYMTTFFVDIRGLPESTASLVFSIGPVVGIFGSLAGGYFAERDRAKKVLSWTIWGCALSILGLSFFSHIYLAVFAYVLYAFFNYAAWSPMNAAVAGLTPLSDRGLGYSVYFFIEGLVASATPTLAAGLIQLTNVWFIFPMSAAFFLVSLFILLFLYQKNGEHVGISSRALEAGP
jgi:predicted MFS family arabinose efflux permease